MLDDVERRTFFVQPPREDSAPASPRLLDVELDEGTGQALILPRSAGVAGAQADHRVAKADRLAGPQSDVADDAVALVEQPEHRDALRHRRHPRHRFGRLRRVDRYRISAVGGLPGIARATIAARAKREHEGQRDQAPEQDYSGFHA